MTLFTGIYAVCYSSYFWGRILQVTPFYFKEEQHETDFGLLLKILAAAIYLLFISTQLYDPLSDGVGGVIWRILNPLMVLGLAVAIVSSYNRKRNVDNVGEDRVSREYLEANCAFYLGITLIAGMLWNWIGSEWPVPENIIAPLWTVIDLIFPLLLFAVGTHWMRSSE